MPSQCIAVKLLGQDVEVERSHLKQPKRLACHQDRACTNQATTNEASMVMLAWPLIFSGCIREQQLGSASARALPYAGEMSYVASKNMYPVGKCILLLLHHHSAFRKGKTQFTGPWSPPAPTFRRRRPHMCTFGSSWTLRHVHL